MVTLVSVRLAVILNTLLRFPDLANAAEVSPNLVRPRISVGGYFRRTRQNSGSAATHFSSGHPNSGCTAKT